MSHSGDTCMSLQALRKVPDVNAAWYPDFIRRFHDIDISIAVQTPVGLMVPILRNADGRGLTDISAGIKTLAGKVQKITGALTSPPPPPGRQGITHFHRVLPAYTESPANSKSQMHWLTCLKFCC